MKSIKKNYLFNLGNQILTFVTPLITAPYLSRVLEADGIGTFSYIESICSYFALMSIGCVVIPIDKDLPVSDIADIMNTAILARVMRMMMMIS